MTLNLKQKSSLFVGISVALLLLAYIGLGRYYLQKSANQLLEDRLQASQTAATRLDEFFSRGVAKLEAVAHLPLLLNDLPAQDALHYLVYKSDIFTDGVYLLNDRGEIIWSEPRDQDIIGTEYPPFEEIKDSFRAETLDATFTVWRGPNGNNEILLSSALVDHAGQPKGYLVGTIPCEHPTIMSTFEFRPTPGIRMQLVAKPGLVIAGTDPERVMRQLPFPETIVRQIENGSGSIISASPSFSTVVTYKALARTPFLVVFDEAEESVFKDARNWKSILTGVGILTMAVVIATLFFVVRSFTKPVELLTEKARRIVAGDMESSFTADRSDELGVLAKTLEDMKLGLKSSYDRLLQSEKMALMGQVVAGIAHELNNPLTIVIGHAELMMMKGVAEDQKQQLTRIHDGAQRASKIVKNLLTFARQKKPERKLSNINSIIAKTVDLRAYELKVSNIELKTELAHNLPAILCDPHQLQQVFLNLIVNAEQAMLDENGKGCLSIKTTQNDGVIEILVQDDGPGIPEEYLRRVFDPFFTTKPVGKGTGLGLAICQGIIAEHGGRLTAASTPGLGATFTVKLPAVVTKVEEAPLPPPPRPTAVPRPRKILIVDDEPPMRDLFSEILSAEGHEVVAACSGKEGLDKVERSQFDMLITDIKMPGGDGPTFYEAIQNRQMPISRRVLFVTGDLMNPSTLKFLENSGNPWIAKPFEVHVVKDAVRRILNS